jgi:hypothetical protein
MDERQMSALEASKAKATGAAVTAHREITCWSLSKKGSN